MYGYSRTSLIVILFSMDGAVSDQGDIRELLGGIRSEVAALKKLKDVQESLTDVDCHVTALEYTCLALPKDNEKLKAKLDDLENRSRRNNIRVIDIPKGSKGSHLSAFIETLLLTVTYKKPDVDRAHRSLAPLPKPNQASRTFITRKLIFRLAREKGQVLYKGVRIHFYPDVSAEVTKQRAAFYQVKAQLRGAGIEFDWLFPARLQINHFGTRHFFDCLQRALEFVKGIAPPSAIIQDPQIATVTQKFQIFPKRSSIGSFRNENPAPCTCQNTKPTNLFVSKDELDDLQKLIHISGKENYVLILVPANNPLQYPMRAVSQHSQIGTMNQRSQIFPNQSNIGPFRNENPAPCTCQKTKPANQYVSKDKLDDLEKRRTEEFRQHQIRSGKENDVLILVPANTPLQYPMRGFRVTPMNKTLIPGLALQTQKRAVYKVCPAEYGFLTKGGGFYVIVISADLFQTVSVWGVNKCEVYKMSSQDMKPLQVSLRVQKGVLSVLNVQEGEKVDGQNEKHLNISSNSLQQLNDLLSRLTYTSTIYHIKTEDLAYFTFENHEVIFPIEIRRLSVPVLFDPGQDVNSQVTVLVKAFLRYKELNVLINSIRWNYPKIKIIVADDSLNPEKVVGDNIEHYIMPPAQGWFAGRNLAVSQVTTKYFLWVDDDFVFLNETRIESFIGGQVESNQFSFKLQYEEGSSEEGGCITRVSGTHAPLPGFDGCFFADGVVNYFLGRTEAVRRVGFDPFLKRVGHTEFFVDGLGDLLVVTCKGLRIGHQKRSSTNKYRFFRHPPKSDSEAKMAHHFFKNHLKCMKY
ncbi:Beta-1,4 N-acetylgalactosaminyltransferase 1 [Labeo rohita]|uniref:Beta-1,4 N-acetylgalactosaminyltransferase 1 n=1 Tax=Labeo rohita TaxID=84645 RepID=A0ABQ8LCX5_LABRO|nr:Beta-1,4 N-acetylgalactosaminyltransferase 1 [Labeo rohita]